jgi:hypothetical protein
MSTPGFLDDRFHAGLVSPQAIRPAAARNTCSQEHEDCQARCDANPGDPSCSCFCRNAYRVCTGRGPLQRC